MTTLDTFTRAYIEAALGRPWITPHQQAENLWTRTTVRRTSPRKHLRRWWKTAASSRLRMRCCFTAAPRGSSEYPIEAQAGHDFWLTRNGHGAGFWDGDWPETGDALTEASKESVR